ncbi:hypothetical protein ANN_06824 [Periplaneta americana]|uniref:Transposase Tc1-like domain-containing protein n=1 Tax=Periplaneta americana TaxID=6978 RepID=A0ABQ8TGN7_PERAM|nr:hypothetical protein ANN_06824 [Periplaneta americana]
MAGLCEGGNEPAGFLKAICSFMKYFVLQPLPLSTSGTEFFSSSLKTRYRGTIVLTCAQMAQRPWETLSVTPRKKGNCGRKRKTSPADDPLIVRKSKLNPRLTALDLTRELMATTGANIHVTTVRRRLLEAGRRARKPIKKQLLTPVMCKKHLMWAKLHQHWTVNDWKNVLSSDESHFEVHGHRVSYVRKGSEKVTAAHLQQAPKYPPKRQIMKAEENLQKLQQRARQERRGKRKNLKDGEEYGYGEH